MSDKTSKFNMGKVLTLKVLRDKAIELQRALDELGKPALDDLSLLPAIYEAYLSVFRRKGCEQRATKAYHRKKFLLVALYLYSPKTLAGGKMRVGLRDRMADLFGLNGRTAISDNCSNLLLSYNHYADFRKDVEEIYSEVVKTIGEVADVCG